MIKRKNLLLHFLIISVIALVLVSFASTTAWADTEFDAITSHLKSHYGAKRVRMPFLGLANFAVKIIRPAGVKSIKLAVFEDLSYAVTGMPDGALNRVMRNALSPEWRPIVCTRSRDGEQTYIYARDEGPNLKLIIVNVDRTEATVLRLKVSPNKLAQFVNNPKLMGISLK